MSDDVCKRCGHANDLLRTIASCGRRFFWNPIDGRVSELELDQRGRVWLVDKWTQRHIYTHYNGEWRGFSDGGTLRNLVIALREYIKRGTKIRKLLGPWPDWINGGDLWGYGKDMGLVRNEARRLGILDDGDQCKTCDGFGTVYQGDDERVCPDPDCTWGTQA